MTLGLTLPDGFTPVKLPALVQPGSTLAFSISLDQPAPAPLQGSVQLRFTPAGTVANSPDSYSDPTMQFADGGTRLSFLIPPGATRAILPANGAFTVGRIAGIIRLEMTSLAAGAVSQLPNPPPAVELTVLSSAPNLFSGTFVTSAIKGETFLGGYVTVLLNSSTREVSKAVFTFKPKPGYQINAASSTVTLDVTNLFAAYYASGTGMSFGGSAQLVIPFGFLEDAIDSVTVTLTNTVGPSAPFSVPLQQCPGIGITSRKTTNRTGFHPSAEAGAGCLTF